MECGYHGFPRIFLRMRLFHVDEGDISIRFLHSANAAVGMKNLSSKVAF